MSEDGSTRSASAGPRPASTSEARPSGTLAVHVQTIPSSDRGFREHVLNLVRRHAPSGPGELQARLAGLFPRVLVRGREISGERPTWYVYRDGRWSPPEAAPWWESAHVGRVALTADGWIVAADPTARTLLGLGDPDTDPRHYSDLIVPGTGADADALFAVVAAGHPVDGTIRLRPTNAGVIACDLHATREGDRIVAAIRLAEDIAWEEPPSVAPVSVSTRPASDVGFREYVDLLVSRMPEPSADGLALRLHRLYPHARVEVVDGHWIATRDEQDEDDAPDGWWLDPALPTVRYDERALIIGANPGAATLLGGDPVGHHWHEYVTPGGTGRVDEFLPIIRQQGVVISRFRIPGPDGALVEFDSYSDVEGDIFRTVIRPRSA